MAARKKKPPQSAPADAKANGWKPPFPGAKPPFKPPAGKGAAAKGTPAKGAATAAPGKGLPPWLAKKPPAKTAPKKKGK